MPWSLDTNTSTLQQQIVPSRTP